MHPDVLIPRPGGVGDRALNPEGQGHVFHLTSSVHSLSLYNEPTRPAVTVTFGSAIAGGQPGLPESGSADRFARRRELDPQPI
jgi:hypothetical protein